MGKDKYGHYINDEGVEIRVFNDKNDRSHVDIYDSCPAENSEHKSIHIKYDSDTGEGSIVDTTDGNKETTDIKCYLTTACMKHLGADFDDNCYELTVLRWFTDNFVSKEDITLYYNIAPIIVENINAIENNEQIYNYIYESIIAPCVKAIENSDYDFAYNRYKNSVLVLSEQFSQKEQEHTFVKKIGSLHNKVLV